MKLRLLLFLFAPLFLLAPQFAHAQIPKPSCTITANTGTVTVGQTVNLSWKSFNATAGNITNIGSVNTSGTQGVIPTPPKTTYVGTFTGPGGSGVCTITIFVNTGTGGFGDGSTGFGTAGTNPVVSPAVISSGEGIVPCSGIDCQACHVAALGQRIINWLIGFSIPLAAALFAWAGIKLFTSQGDMNRMTEAKSIFRSVGIGFVIVLCAWLGIQTILKTVLKDSYYKSWNTIECVQNPINSQGGRQLNKPISDLLNSLPLLNKNAVLPGGYGTGVGQPGSGLVNTSTGCTEGGYFNPDTGTCTGAFGNEYRPNVGNRTSCPAGYTYDAPSEDDPVGSCYNDADPDKVVEPIANASSNSNPQFNQQLSIACAQFGNCDMAQRIAGRESGNGADCTTSPTGAAGCMQVLATTACGIDSSISDACGACRASRQSLSAACAPVIQTIRENPQTGVNLGVRYIDDMRTMPALAPYRSQFGECQITAAAYFQGPGEVIKYGGVPPKAVTYVNKACN